MAIQSTSAAMTPKRLIPAWGFSFLIHALAIILLAIVINPWPRGAVETPTGSMGVVLNESSRDGDLHEGDEGQGNHAGALQQVPEPPPLMPTPLGAPAVAQVEHQPATTLPVKLAAAPAAPAKTEQPSVRQTLAGKGRSGSPGGSGYASVSVFGVEGKGNKFVYLFDRSASMEGAPLAAAKRQLLESLRSLDSIHQFQIIFFNSRTRVFDASGGGRRVAFATDRNKQLAANFVGGITADGGTDRMVALREALGFSPDVIFFLTDADDPMSASELREIARLNERTQAAICVIEFGRQTAPLPNNFLMQVARESGGKYGFINTATLSQPAASSR
jgi:hypothetical protein